MERREAERSRGEHFGQDSDSKRGVEHPAGDSAADTADEEGHQTSVAAPATGDETPTRCRSPEGAQGPAPPQPGPALVNGQRSVRPKAYSLIDKVYGWNNLNTAWRRVRANKGAHGLDRVTIRDFEADLEKHLNEIQRKLKQDRFEPQPVRRVYIPKPGDPSARRPLGVPVVADRVVQQALLQVLDPLFDADMSERSFGFRKGRKAHHAIATVIRDGKAGYRHVVDADVASFFDRLDHQVTMSRVRLRVGDGRVLKLIEAFLKAGVYEAGVVSVPQQGTPQGGVISPWLANLVLDDLDKALESRGYRHVRYADDFVVLCTTPEEAAQAKSFVEEVLGQLKLSLHETKTRLTDFREGFDFLGFRFRWYRLGIRAKSLDRLKDKVRLLTRRQQGRNVDAILQDLNPVLRGFARYFGSAEVGGLFVRLDAWVRMRVRAFKSKRRRRTDNRRIRNRRLAKWGLLSLQQCRPHERLSYMRAAAPRASSRPLAMRLPRGVAQCGNAAC
jgi:group II intron reverse transcriptase/maturase